MGDAPDEYDAYFDALDDEDLAAFDNICAQFLTSTPTPVPRPPPENNVSNVSKSSEIATPALTTENELVFGGSGALVHSDTALTTTGTYVPSSKSQVVETKPKIVSRSPKSVGNDPPTVPHVSLAVSKPAISLLRMFRPRGRLSVTDLVSPSWCEFKFDYSLRGHRWKGENMDDVIISKHGKAIPVQKTVVVQAEKVMKQGEAVHKKLEEELPMVEVVVKVKTAEERFALQILNMIANFQMISTVGTCREFHVMGFINDIYITGIIDEISRQPVGTPLPSPSKRPTSYMAKSPRKKSKQTPDDTKQKKLDSFFPISPSKSRSAVPPPDPPLLPPALVDEPVDIEMRSPNATPESSQKNDVDPSDARVEVVQEPRYRLHLNDTKTRSSPNLPSDDLSGRLQLMLYHELLDQLLRPPSPPLSSNMPSTAKLSFSFPTLFEHLQLDPKRRFSDEFIADATHLIENSDVFDSNPSVSGTLVRSLNDLVGRWYGTVNALALEDKPNTATSSAEVTGPIDPNLQLVYRLRGGASAKTRDGRRDPKGKEKGKGKQKEVDDDPALQAAINASLKEPSGAGVLHLTEEEQLELAIAESIRLLAEETAGRAGTSVSSTTLLNPPGVSVDLRSASASPLPESDKETDVIEQEIQISLSQKSEMEWERTVGEAGVAASELVAVEMPDVAKASPSKKRDSVKPDPKREVSDDEPLPTLQLGRSTKSPAPVRVASEKNAKPQTRTAKLDTPSKSPSRSKKDPSSSKTLSKKRDTGIIGVKKFLFDPNLLNQHLTAALEFWQGEREPRGVELEDTWKCGMCEYRDGCEWREAKAIEAVATFRQKGKSTTS